MVKVSIFHEGNSDYKLLQLLIEHLQFNLSYVQFVKMGSKSNFFDTDNTNYKELLLNRSNESIARVLFVLDADDEENDRKYGGFENTLEQLNATLTNLELDPCYDIYVTCDPNTKCGYLESLILSTISDEQKTCINNFLDCSEFSSKENHKAILNQIYNLGYPNAPFDFSHDNFDELKAKLQHLFEAIEPT